MIVALDEQSFWDKYSLKKNTSWKFHIDFNVNFNANIVIFHKELHQR